MRKTGILLTLTFVFYLIGQAIWLFVIICDDPLFGSKYLEDIIIFLMFTVSGIFGLMSGIELYRSNK